MTIDVYNARLCGGEWRLLYEVDGRVYFPSGVEISDTLIEVTMPVDLDTALMVLAKVREARILEERLRAGTPQKADEREFAARVEGGGA